MKTKMLIAIASLLSLSWGCATTNDADRRIAGRGTLTALLQPAGPEHTTYSGVERVGSSFRDGSHGRVR